MRNYLYTLPHADHLTPLDHYRLGRLYRFPLCCVLEFTFRNLFGCHRRDTATFGRANGVEYVECQLHRRHP